MRNWGRPRKAQSLAECRQYTVRTPSMHRQRTGTNALTETGALIVEPM